MNKRRLLALLTALVLTAALIPAAQAAQAPQAAQTSNINNHQYAGGRWSSTVKSYLCENQWGGLSRVEYANGQVIIEDYNASFALLSSRTIQPELPIWGGFFAAENYNFLVFGQNNQEEDDSREVIRIVKYDKSWTRLDSASLYGANTVAPFAYGSLRCDEYGGYLYVRTCHTMYTTSDGLNHQANVMLSIRQSDMEVTDFFYAVGNIDYGYVSHSFNQFVLVDQQGCIVAADHGDAYPRSIVLTRYYAQAGQDKFQSNTLVPLGGGRYTYAWCENVDIQTFDGPIGANDTGAALGGVAETANGYVAAYGYSPIDTSDPLSVYLAFVDKDLSVSANRLSIGIGASTPHLAPTGLEGGYVIWNELLTMNSKGGYEYNDQRDILHYAAYDANGNTGEVKTAKAALSDCAPVYHNGKVVWYVTDNSAPTFYLLDADGVTSRTATAPTAHASTQTVKLDGKDVTFYVYQIAADGGNGSNYVKLRDLACALNGTAAQFEVDYDHSANCITLTGGQSYTVQGGEMEPNASGDQPCQPGNSALLVNGEAVQPEVYTINGYNYFKLRDLGRALDFNVSYIDGGIVISPSEPYSDAQ